MVVLVCAGCTGSSDPWPSTGLEAWPGESPQAHAITLLGHPVGYQLTGRQGDRVERRRHYRFAIGGEVVDRYVVQSDAVFDAEAVAGAVVRFNLEGLAPV